MHDWIDIDQRQRFIGATSGCSSPQTGPADLFDMCFIIGTKHLAFLQALVKKKKNAPVPLMYVPGNGVS